MNAKGADIRHTSHGSPQTTPKYGKAAPVRVAVPIIGVCSFSLGGDCETIEQYVLENVQVRNPFAKIANFFEISIIYERGLTAISRLLHLRREPLASLEHCRTLKVSFTNNNYHLTIHPA